MRVRGLILVLALVLVMPLVYSLDEPGVVCRGDGGFSNRITCDNSVNPAGCLRDNRNFQACPSTDMTCVLENQDKAWCIDSANGCFTDDWCPGTACRTADYLCEDTPASDLKGYICSFDREAQGFAYDGANYYRDSSDCDYQVEINNRGDGCSVSVVRDRGTCSYTGFKFENTCAPGSTPVLNGSAIWCIDEIRGCVVHDDCEVANGEFCNQNLLCEASVPPSTTPGPCQNVGCPDGLQCLSDGTCDYDTSSGDACTSNADCGNENYACRDEPGPDVCRQHSNFGAFNKFPDNAWSILHDDESSSKYLIWSGSNIDRIKRWKADITPDICDHNTEALSGKKRYITWYGKVDGPKDIEITLKPESSYNYHVDNNMFFRAYDMTGELVAQDSIRYHDDVDTDLLQLSLDAAGPNWYKFVFYFGDDGGTVACDGSFQQAFNDIFMTSNEPDNRPLVDSGAFWDGTKQVEFPGHLSNTVQIGSSAVGISKWLAPGAWHRIDLPNNIDPHGVLASCERANVWLDKRSLDSNVLYAKITAYQSDHLLCNFFIYDQSLEGESSGIGFQTLEVTGDREASPTVVNTGGAVNGAPIATCNGVATGFKKNSNDDLNVWMQYTSGDPECTVAWPTLGENVHNLENTDIQFKERTLAGDYDGFGNDPIGIVAFDFTLAGAVVRCSDDFGSSWNYNQGTDWNNDGEQDTFSNGNPIPESNYDEVDEQLRVRYNILDDKVYLYGGHQIDDVQCTVMAWSNETSSGVRH